MTTRRRILRLLAIAWLTLLGGGLIGFLICAFLAVPGLPMVVVAYLALVGAALLMGWSVLYLHQTREGRS